MLRLSSFQIVAIFSSYCAALVNTSPLLYFINILAMNLTSSADEYHKLQGKISLYMRYLRI